MFPDITETGMSDHELADFLLEQHHVAVVPGSAGCLPGDWFPDNERFLINCEGQLGVATRAAVVETEVAIVPPGDRPTLSPDGKLLALGGSGDAPRTSIEIRLTIRT